MGWVAAAVAPVVVVACSPAAPVACSPAAPVAKRPAPMPTAVGSPSTSTSAAAPAPDVLPAELTDEAVCAASVSEGGAALPGVSAVEHVDPMCPETNHFCDTVDKAPPEVDACFVANDNIRRAEQQSRRGRVVAPRRAAPAGTSGLAFRPTLPTVGLPWDKKGAPKYLKEIDAHLHLNAAEHALLKKNGFVALDRLQHASYATAYHDIFQQQLPVFISIDSVLHTIFQSNSIVLKTIERKQLVPALGRIVDRLHKTLQRSAKRYGSELRNDLGIYVAVAHGLFHGDAKGCNALAAGVREQCSDLLERARGGSGLESASVFGRMRMIDYSQFEPRGHYAEHAQYAVAAPAVPASQYFRAYMWLSRFEFNLVSRSCRSSQPGEAPNAEETPREARVMIGLADLVRRSGVAADIKKFDKVYGAFAGGREDVSVFDVQKLGRQHRFSHADPAGAQKLRAAIGKGFRRTASTHFMPQGTRELPAIGTLFGIRIVPEIAPLEGLVHDKVAGRDTLGAGDVAYTLGHDRAKVYVENKESGLDAALDAGRESFKKSTSKPTDLYGHWVSAVRALSEPSRGARPAFMKSPAYADMRMNSALIGYGQIRHNYVLMAGQGYDSYGCEIPDGFVEPALATYDALLGYTRAARRLTPSVGKYFKRVEAVLTMLRSIVVTELSGKALSEPQKRWLGMVAEYIPQGGFGVDSGQPPKWTGWYFDLFPDREKGARKSPEFVADYFTLTNRGKAKYLGAESPRLAVFVVDVGGKPRAMVGPVGKGYEVETDLSKRLTDDSARTAKGKSAPWLTYFGANVPEPPLRGRLVKCPSDQRVVIQSDRQLGRTSVTLVDHHGDALVQPVIRSVGRHSAVFAFKPQHQVEGVHVHVHDLSLSKVGTGRYDTVIGLRAYWPSPDKYVPPAGPGFGFTRGGMKSDRPAPALRGF